MQTLNLESSCQECPIKRVAERISIGGVVDHFQGALFNLGLFGPGIGAVIISGLFLLISLFHQVAQCGAEKGVV